MRAARRRPASRSGPSRARTLAARRDRGSGCRRRPKRSAVVSAFERVVIAGAGAFGTALAVIADKAGRRVTLVARDSAQAATISSSRENVRYLPGVTLAPSIEVTGDRAASATARPRILRGDRAGNNACVAAALIAKILPAGTPTSCRGQGHTSSGPASCSRDHARGTSSADAGPAGLRPRIFGEESIRARPPTGVTVAASDLALSRMRYRPR